MSAVRISPVISQRGQEYLMVQLARQYRNPFDGLREYTTNALDAVEESPDTGAIKLALDSRGLNVLVSDNASGMDESRMKELPVNIGDSAKRDKPDKRGEKAVGLLAFGSMGNYLYLISKTKGDTRYNSLRYSIEGREGNERLTTEFERFTEKDMDNNFYGGFSHGTRAVINVNKSLFARNFRPSEIRRFLQQTYAPILDGNGRIAFFFETIGANETEAEQVIPTKPKGEILHKYGGVPFDVKKDGAIVQYFLQTNLRFNPASNSESVALFSKGVRVYDSIGQLDEKLSDLPLWNCKHVGGYINEPNLSLILGRLGINRNSNAYSSLVELLEKINEQLWPVVESKLKGLEKEKANSSIKKAWEEIAQTLREYTDPFDRIRIIDSPETSRQSEQPKHPRQPRKEDEEREPRRISNPVPFKGIVVRGFDLQDRHKRSSLEGTLDKPCIVVNEEHPDYINNVQEGTTKTALGYLIDVVSGPIGIHQTRQSAGKGRTFRDEFEFSAEAVRRGENVRIKTLSRLNKKDSSRKGGK